MSELRRNTVVGLLILSACTFDPQTHTRSPSPGESVLSPPSVAAISAQTIHIGDPLDIMGSGFIPADQGEVEVTFRGSYSPFGERPDVANYTVRAVAVSDTLLHIEHFGPYRVPFTRGGNEIGLFTGGVFATNLSVDGAHQARQDESSWPMVQLTIAPSLVVSQVVARGASWSASCIEPSSELLELIPYRFRAETAGFDAPQIRYSLSGALLSDTSTMANTPQILGVTTSFVHQTLGPVDVLGAGERIAFAEVPYGVNTYQTTLLIEALDDHASPLAHLEVALVVHRPIEIADSQSTQAIERYAPVIEPPCRDARADAISMSYAETEHEGHLRSLQLALTPMFWDSYGQTLAASYEGGDAKHNTIGFAMSAPLEISWNVGGDQFGGGKLEMIDLAKAGFALDGVAIGTKSYSDAVAASHAITSGPWIASSENAMSGTTSGMIPSGRSGVFYRQAQRVHRSATVLARDLCGGSASIGQAVLEDWTWQAELAVGASCSPPPPSSLTAACLVTPCE
jgi:hypothetical protein